MVSKAPPNWVEGDACTSHLDLQVSPYNLMREQDTEEVHLVLEASSIRNSDEHHIFSSLGFLAHVP